MKECENRYPWDAANDSVDGMRHAVDRFRDRMVTTVVLGGVVLVVLLFAQFFYIEHENAEYNADYGLGSMVTTTTVYGGLTGDSFTGVVIRGETMDDPALTVRNRDGTERRIATEFLEPIR